MMDEHTRRLVAEKGIDRTIPDSGVVPGDVVDLFVAGTIPREDLLARLRRMPVLPEPVVDASQFESPIEILELYEELRGRVGCFWVIDEAAKRVSRFENTGSAIVIAHTPI